MSGLLAKNHGRKSIDTWFVCTAQSQYLLLFFMYTWVEGLADKIQWRDQWQNVLCEYQWVFRLPLLLSKDSSFPLLHLGCITVKRLIDKILWRAVKIISEFVWLFGSNSSLFILHLYIGKKVTWWNIKILVTDSFVYVWLKTHVSAKEVCKIYKKKLDNSQSWQLQKERLIRFENVIYKVEV